MKDNEANVTSISIQGNSYSLDFCKKLAEIFLAKTENLKVQAYLKIRLLISMIFLSQEAKKKFLPQFKPYLKR